MKAVKVIVSVFLAVTVAIGSVSATGIVTPPDIFNESGVYEGVDYTKNSTAYDPKIWDSNVTYNESVMFYETRTKAKLLYPIDKIVSVRSYDLQTEYKEGVDYRVTNGELEVINGSSMAVYPTLKDIYNLIGDSSEVDWGAISNWEPKQFKYQYMVTYTHTKTWDKDSFYLHKPKSQLDKLAKFVEKAKSGQTTNVVFYGDSITVGCSTSGMYEPSWKYDASKTAGELEPYIVDKMARYGLSHDNPPDWICETWPRAVTEKFKEMYNNENITYTNRAVGSTDSVWGARGSNYKYMLSSDSKCPVPDLLFIGFGGNESQRSGKDFIANLRTIIDYARKRNKNCAIIILSTFALNHYDSTKGLVANKLSEQEASSYELMNEYDGLTVAPINTVFSSMIKYKNPCDYTNNCFNHPNDFGARVYAATMLSLFTPDSKIDIPSEATVWGVTGKTYNGKAQTQKPEVYVRGEELTPGKDYTLSYKNNIKVGTATVTVIGKGGYKGSLSKTFKISAASLKGITVSGVKQKIYSGKAQTQSATLKFGGKALVKNVDYTVSYKNNKDVGKASVIFKGKGNFTGTVVKSFNIVPKGTNILKLTPARKSIRVKVKKQTAGTNGYEVQCSLKKSFKASKTVTAGKTKTTVTVKGLKSGKKYFVRVRTYKKSGGKKYVSAWSTVKYKKTK